MADSTATDRITVAEATEQVQLMARRTALLYHHIATVMVEQLGEERATALLEEAVRRYGTEAGEGVRDGVKAMGLPLTPENYNKVRDLPAYGWETAVRPDDMGVDRGAVTYCPLAAVWLEKGSQKLGRIYCHVDQAKYLAYNNLRCVHLKNVLDGDDCCLFAIGEDEHRE